MFLTQEILDEFDDVSYDEMIVYIKYQELTPKQCELVLELAEQYNCKSAIELGNKTKTKIENRINLVREILPFKALDKLEKEIKNES